MKCPALIVYHGTNKKHDMIQSGSWVAKQITEASLWGFLKAHDTSHGEVCVAKLQIDENNVEWVNDIHGITTSDLEVTNWYNKNELTDKVELPVSLLIYGNTSVIDLTPILKNASA